MTRSSRCTWASAEHSANKLWLSTPLVASWWPFTPHDLPSVSVDSLCALKVYLETVSDAWWMLIFAVKVYCWVSGFDVHVWGKAFHHHDKDDDVCVDQSKTVFETIVDVFLAMRTYCTNQFGVWLTTFLFLTKLLSIRDTWWQSDVMGCTNILTVIMKIFIRHIIVIAVVIK